MQLHFSIANDAKVMKIYFIIIILHKISTQENVPLDICTPMAKVRKRAKIRNRYNQTPHLTYDTKTCADEYVF